MTAKANGTYREFTVDDNFSRQARRPGGLSRAEALKRAQAELTQLRPRIEEHIKRQCERLEAALLAARGRDENRPSPLGDAYAASLSLREVADTIGYTMVGFIAANLCTIIETADAAHTDCPAAVIDCHCDALRLALHPHYRGKPLRELAELSAGLSEIVAIAKAMAARIDATGTAPTPPAAKPS